MDGSRIRSITAEGLLYVDDDGREQFIDFATCHANHLRKTTAPEYIERMRELNPHLQWDEEGIKKYIQDETDGREVGCRNIDSRYIQFYTDPLIHFDFPTADEAQRVRMTIQRFGWYTFDLT